MKADIQKMLSDRIRDNYCLSHEIARNKALQILERCPEQLLPNVEQWAVGEKLTDIYVGKYSIPMIMAIWEHQDFISALDTITEYFVGDRDAAERRIWQMRR